MGLLFFVACLASTILVFGEEALHRYGMIEICGGNEKKYVKPGDDFDMPCKSDHSTDISIYRPTDTLPSEEEILEDANLGSEAKRTTETIELEDATKGKDDGWYTCVVHHGPGFDVKYSTQKCLVIIRDLCEDSDCKEAEICEPNYETGTFECTCNYNCSFDYDPVCTDTCEFFFNKCLMEQESCKDRKARSVASKGTCAGNVEPEIRQIDQDIECKLGETINLASGLVTDGTPGASIQWNFYPEHGSVAYINATKKYELECSEDAAGVYQINLMYCMNRTSAVRNEYRVSFKEITAAPPTAAPPTTSFGKFAQRKHVCSSYPGGVIEDFNSNSHFYDLSCTHVLAADLMPGGDYTKPWFIYGTYDQLDKKKALVTMTFYISNNVFEFQRGWIVHTGDGNKMKLEEDVAQDVGDSGCFVVFLREGSVINSLGRRHLKLSCSHINLEAYYDGLMSGHIRFTNEGDSTDLVPSHGNIGLCYNTDSGWRTNWQIGKTDGKCEIDGDKEHCTETAPDSCDLAQPARLPSTSWTTCGVGASAACNELHCEGHDPTAAQKCALEQANRMNCDLKVGKDRNRVDTSCPKDDCEWMKYVVSKGCPQDNLPFVCPR